MPYAAPIADMRFVLEEVARIGEVAALPGYEAAEPDLVDAILGEAAKFARSRAGAAEPAGRPGRQHPRKRRRAHPAGVSRGLCPLCRGRLERARRRSRIMAGRACPWPSRPRSPRCGTRPCMSVCAVPAADLGRDRIAAGLRLGDEQKRLYLGRLVSRRMDRHDEFDRAAGRLRSRRADHPRGAGPRSGVGRPLPDHRPEDLHHLWRPRSGPEHRPRGAGAHARSAAGHAGASHCSWCRNSCPTRRPSPGGPGRRNAVRTLGLEHKLGIHASPTCVLAYEDAIGWRIGEENRGLEYMFTMMNNARLNIGVQGVAIAERAYQQARDFARTRVQGRPLGAAADGGPLPIIHHPDVRRMLLSMRAATEAMRALAYYAAATVDHARRHPDPAARARAQRRADLLIPVVKAWCSDHGRRRRLDRHPGAWRHGLHRGDRRGAALARRAHRADLRGHQRHPGERPRRPQARCATAARRRARCSTTSTRPWRSWSRPAGPTIRISPRSAARCGARSTALKTATACLVETERRPRRRPVRSPISKCSASSAPAG